MVQLDRRDFVRGRRHVVGEVGGEDVAALVVDDLLEERVADALRDAAVHLAVGDHRIDDAAGVLADQIALDARRRRSRHRARQSRRGRRWSRCRAGRRWPVSLRPGIDLALEAMRLRIGLARHARDGDRAVGARDLGLAVLQHDVGLGRFQHVCRRSSMSLARTLRAATMSGAAGNHHRPAGEGAPAIGGPVGVAVDDVDRSGRTPISSAMSWRSACSQALAVR